jgi:MinD-like ATPase involved in chromosome partitioning or flagellar assembly
VRTAPVIESVDTSDPREFEGARFLLAETPPPAAGWRRVMWRASGGRYVPQPSATEVRQRAFIDRIRVRTANCQRVAVASAKGGVGKTTATVLLGTAMAMHRLDRVIAIDANPDAGSLGWRVDRETESTLTDMLNHVSKIERYSDVRAFTSQAASRLEILASELDPAVSQALREEDYASVIEVLERYYSVVFCDLGTGLLDSATQGLLKLAGQLVVVAAPSIDSGRVANFTLDFVERRHPEKAANAVVVINNCRNDGLVDVGAMKRHFGRRARAVITIPYDRHLANGATPNWDLLKPTTRDAYLEAAAAVSDGFEG